MNDSRLIAGPQGVLIEECNCLTVNYFDITKLKAEKVKVKTGSYDNSAQL